MLNAALVLLLAAQNAPAAAPPAAPAAPAAPATAPATAPAAKPATPPAKPAADANAAFPRLSLSRVMPAMGFTRPIQVVFEPGDSTRMYVVEQQGRVLLVDLSKSDATEPTVVLDIRPQVNSSSNEEGLLSMAFHPKFAQNHQVFLYYASLDGKKRSTKLSRFVADAATHAIKPDSEELLLQVPQPYWNHKGGTALFGPDGMLYLSLGDGGAANDPHGNGQNLGTLLAKVLRIDVDKPGTDTTYSIPADNPFVAVKGARPEIWAYGLRNAWRMSFDRSTGQLYAGDVGQNLFEEVDIVRKGGNYGWNVREGLHEFRGGKAGTFGSDYTDPIVEYPRDQGNSITGGYVYRGADASLQGVYLYTDLSSGHIWGLRTKDDQLVAGPKVIGQLRGQLPTSFGEAGDGTLYITTFEGSQDSQAKGGIWRIGTAR